VGVKLADGTLCAGVFFLRFRDRIIFHFAASDSRARQNGAMFLLVNEVLKAESGQPAILDFEGSDTASVARFTKVLEPEVVYPQMSFNHLPPFFRVVSPFING